MSEDDDKAYNVRGMMNWPCKLPHPFTTSPRDSSLNAFDLRIEFIGVNFIPNNIKIPLGMGLSLEVLLLCQSRRIKRLHFESDVSSLPDPFPGFGKDQVFL